MKFGALLLDSLIKTARTTRNEPAFFLSRDITTSKNQQISVIKLSHSVFKELIVSGVRATTTNKFLPMLVPSREWNNRNNKVILFYL